MSMKSLTEIGKLISLVLRHHPEALGLSIDEHGWMDTKALIEKLNEKQPFDMAMLEEIVRTNNKQRYSFNADKTRIRANQGHSIPVDLELLPQTPPKVLYHGTATRFAASIEEQGLKPMERQYVHLTDQYETAVAVGKRHGKPLVYEVDAEAMQAAGRLFYRSENGVWLTDAVPPEYLKRKET
ncbi:MAG: RNA 2'-phosphotransferase [Clostridia bacterium]|nr:RNA 2'-phosphotransferase [Clostridia bacterium]